MELRDQILIDNRPEIASAKVLPGTTSEEAFQNITLRPVVKMQNDLLLLAFHNYISKHKNMFQSLSVEKKIEYIEKALQKDSKFRNSLKGMILGQFTLEEFEVYIQNSSALTKRMINLVKERLIDQVQHF